uniref:Uncharacterized protein n=1 Tax=Anguilla anguilla TaxID=7936 RepID=A0A0E9WTG4_ANGAN
MCKCSQVYPIRCFRLQGTGPLLFCSIKSGIKADQCTGLTFLG